MKVDPSIDIKGTCADGSRCSIASVCADAIVETELNEVKHEEPSPRRKSRKLQSKVYLKDDSSMVELAVLTI